MGDDVDPLRVKLLEAAQRVFARQGYEGARIGDIVREAGLSAGAVYGRFRSKSELLREAVVSHAATDGRLPRDVDRVSELVVRGAAWSDAPLTLREAVRLEAQAAARRDPAVATALEEAQQRWRASVEPLLQQALRDGTVAPDVDPEAVLAFVRTLSLGLLVQRAAGAKAPDPQAWADLMHRVVASFGTPTTTTTTETTNDTAPTGATGQEGS
jgi:AcrR family transcriptional regulator